MSTEMDLVHDFMNAVDVSAEELPVARSILEDAICLEVGHDQRGDAATRVGRRNRRRSRRLARWSIGVTVAAAAIAALILQVAPTSKVTTSEAAAAEIARLADAVQPAPALLAGQWYQYKLQGVLSAHVSTVGNTPTPNAQASIPIAIGQWSNSTGAICTSQQFGTATFASPVNAQAWQAIGLVDTPNNQPATGCSAGVEASIGGGSSLATIDVSNITHDPVTLAAQLQDGTTGIQSIDQHAVGEPANVAGFVRLTVLLVGPTSGQWPGFGQEMLNTMALLPGVISLGDMTSHSGVAGIGFSMATQVTLNPTNGAVSSSFYFSPPTVILDPQSGALLEVRNLDIPVLQTAAQDFVGSPSAAVYTEGVSYGISTQWIDPVAAVSVIAQAALPSWINTVHIIEAVTNPSTTDTEISAVLNPFLGNGNSAYSDGNSPRAGETTYDITIVGSAANEQAVVSALTASGLFASISVKL
jgi:hypothetical protein